MKRYERRIEDKNYLILVMKVLVDIVVVAGVALFLVVHFGATMIVSGYSMDSTLTNKDVVLSLLINIAVNNVMKENPNTTIPGVKFSNS